MISKLTEQIPNRERFIILAREPSPITRQFESIFSSHGQVEVIVDSEPSSGDSVIGYHGLLDTFFPTWQVLDRRDEGAFVPI